MSSDKVPLTGFVSSVASSLDLVRPGMAFIAEGASISFFDKGDVGNSAIIINTLGFIPGKSDSVDSLVECHITSRRQRAIFHILGRPSVQERVLSFHVAEYLTWPEGAELDEIDTLRFTGPCVDSFIPRRANISLDNLTISIPGPEDTKINEGTAAIQGKEVSLDAVAGWRLLGSSELRFSSALRAHVDGVNLSFLGELYRSIRTSLEFCVGRHNIAIEVSLDSERGIRWLIPGSYVVPKSKTAIPDEYDGNDRQFVRANDIGEGFAKLLQASSTHDIAHPSFALSRDDVNILTRSKIIELTSAFEGEFHLLFPEGVKHSGKTRRSRDEAIATVRRICEEALEEDGFVDLAFEALLQIEMEGLRGKISELIRSASREAKKQVRKELDRAIVELERDSLQSRIKYALESLPSKVSEACRRGLCLSDNIGQPLADARNKIAHGAEGERLLESARDEYLMVRRLVFAMQLKRLGFDDDEVARLVKLMP